MRTVFISDLHLTDERPDITQALLNFLTVQCIQSAEKTDSLYILGDFFEAWIGDDLVNALITRVKTALTQVSNAGTAIYFMHGNRDFLVGQSFCSDIGATLLNDDSHTITLQGKTTLLMHGDTLCTQDTDYLAFRSLVRNPEWQKDFLNKTIPERLNIARQIRQQSQQSATTKSEYIMDAETEEIERAISQAKADILIHGHTHRPNTHKVNLPNQPTRYVLGDWDKKGWSLISDSQGIRLTSFDIPTVT